MKRRSNCPINFALEEIGDKWSLLVIRDLMFKGKRYYNEFFDSEEKVSTSVLGDRLKTLETSGIISRSVDPVKKSRIRYSLTEKGIALLPMMLEMIIWGGEFDENTGATKEFLQQVKEDREGYLEKMRVKIIVEHLG